MRGPKGMKLSLTFLAPSPLKLVMRQVSLPSIQRQRPSLKGQHESEPTDDLAEYAVSYSLITLFASVILLHGYPNKHIFFAMIQKIHMK